MTLQISKLKVMQYQQLCKHSRRIPPTWQLL